MVKTYIKKDLIDYVDTPLELSRTRAKMIEENLPDDAVVFSERSGGYQGEIAIIIILDGYFWFIHAYYGSCSGCDAFMAHEAEETERLLRGAYCFEATEDALTYIESTDTFGYGAGNLRMWSKDMFTNIYDVITETYLFGDVYGVICPDTLS